MQLCQILAPQGVRYSPIKCVCMRFGGNDPRNQRSECSSRNPVIQPPAQPHTQSLITVSVRHLNPAMQRHRTLI